MTDLKLRLELHQKQSEAFNSPATEILYGGAAGSGKSHLMRVKALACCVAIPGFQGFLFRRTFDELIKGHMVGPKGFRAMLADWTNAGYAQIVEKEIRFPKTQSCLHLCHCESENDVYKYQSAEMHGLFVDELTTFQEDAYRFLRTRVRAPGLKLPPGWEGRVPFILNGSNPGNIGHDFVKRTWIDSYPPMTIWRAPADEGGMLRQYIPARLADNPSMAEDDPTYEDRLSGMGSEALVQMFRDGNWDVVAGAFFSDFSRERHVVTPCSLPADWMRFGAYDWGGARPFCYLWCALSDGSLPQFPRGAIVVYREYYGSSKPNVGLNMRDTDIAKAILQMTGSEHLAYSVGDPSIQNKHGGPSSQETMSAAGLHVRLGDNDRIAGCKQIIDRLKGEDGRPMLYVFSTCLNLIRTFPLQQHDKHKPEVYDTEIEDHAIDALKYGLMSRPWQPAAKPIDEAKESYKAAVTPFFAQHLKRRAARRAGLR